MVCWRKEARVVAFTLTRECRDRTIGVTAIEVLHFLLSVEEEGGLDLSRGRVWCSESSDGVVQKFGVEWPGR